MFIERIWYARLQSGTLKHLLNGIQSFRIQEIKTYINAMCRRNCDCVLNIGKQVIATGRVH